MTQIPMSPSLAVELVVALAALYAVGRWSHAIETLTKAITELRDALTGHTEKLTDHEGRIAFLEGSQSRDP